MNNLNDSNAEILSKERYIPSEALVNILQKSIVEKGTVKLFIEKDQLDSSTSIASKNILATHLSNAVQCFMATISQGLAYGDGEMAILTKNGQLTEDLMTGFMFRLPILEEYKEQFNKELYKDLFKAANTNSITNEFGKVVMQEGEIIIQRTKIITPKISATRERAKVVRLG